MPQERHFPAAFLYEYYCNIVGLFKRFVPKIFPTGDQTVAANIQDHHLGIVMGEPTADVELPGSRMVTDPDLLILPDRIYSISADGWL